MKFNKFYSLSAAALLALALGGTAHVQKANAASYNYPVATATQKPNSQLYDSRGKATAQVVPANTDWRVSDIQTINGQKMYKIAPNTWLPSSESYNNFAPTSYNYHVVRAIAPKTKYAALYDNNFKVIPERVVPNFSDWKVGKTQVVNGKTFYKIDDHEWISSDDGVANFSVNGNNNSSSNTTSNSSNTNHLNSSNTSNSGQNYSFDALATQQAMIKELNRLRTMNGLNTLQENPELSNFSMARAQRLANAGQLDNHEGAYGNVNPNDGLNEENIGVQPIESTPEKNAIDATSGFFHDYGVPGAGHRQNMLDPFITQIGMGVANDDKGNIYIVQTLYAPSSTITDYDYYNQMISYENGPAPTGVYDH